MKKILLLITGLLLPIITFAAPNPDDYTSMNLIEAINGEESLFSGADGYTSIDLSINKVDDSDDQVTVYAFIGYGCSICHSFLTYLNEIAPEYDAKFQLKAFELWRTESAAENGELAKAVQDFVGTSKIQGDIENGNGVPVIIIGETVLQGFDEEAVKNAIDTEYAKDPKDRYDIFEAMREAEKEAEKKENAKNLGIIIANIVTVAIATLIIILFINSQNNKIHDRIDEIYNKLGIDIENPEKKANLISIAKIDDEELEKVTKNNDEKEYEIKEEKTKEKTKKVTDSQKKNTKNKSKK